MKIKLNFSALVFALIVGFLIIPTFAFTTGEEFTSLRYPVLAILSGFIISGFTAGYFSKGIYNIEPGIAAIILSIACSFIIPALQLKALSSMNHSDWVILFMNAVFCTYIGSWLSYKAQKELLDEKLPVEKEIINWGDLIFNSILALITTMISGNLFVYLLGYNSSYNFVNLIICMLVTGLLTGYKSKNRTLIKSSVSALLSITFCFDILRFSFASSGEISISYLVTALILGYLIAIIGSYTGLRIQKYFKN